MYVIFIYTYVYMYTSLHRHTRTPIHMYIHAYIHTCIHLYIHMSIHPCTCMYIHAYICTYMHTCTHAYMHTCIHAYMHTYTHTNMHTHTSICIYTCMYTYGLAPLFFSSTLSQDSKLCTLACKSYCLIRVILRPWCLLLGVGMSSSIRFVNGSGFAPSTPLFGFDLGATCSELQRPKLRDILPRPMRYELEPTLSKSSQTV